METIFLGEQIQWHWNTIRGYSLFAIMMNPEDFQWSTRWVFDQLAAGKLKPIIARTFTLSQIVDADRYM